MAGPCKLTRCEAHIVEIAPPHNYTVRTGKEPGTKVILVEWNYKSTVNLWPPNKADPRLMAGFVVDKETATKLSVRLKELVESMEESTAGS